MNLQLQAVALEFDQAQKRLDALAARLPDELWPVRAEPEQWSVSECVTHLNVTSRAYLPALRAGLEEARDTAVPAPRRYRRDPVGWMLWKTQGPPVRIRFKTAAAFVPDSSDSPDELRADFGRLQEEQLACVHDADGLPLHKVKLTSPFDSRASYNLFAALSILPRHQHRHLWQAEQVAQKLTQEKAAS